MTTDEIRFFRCDNCGNIITKLHDSSVGVVCCGARMTELIPKRNDEAGEKHVPKCECEGNRVRVKIGEVPHPMTDSHYIQWICIKTTNGMQIHYLKPGDEPEACFVIGDGEKLEAVYEYCNLHSLWRS